MVIFEHAWVSYSANKEGTRRVLKLRSFTRSLREVLRSFREVSSEIKKSEVYQEIAVYFGNTKVKKKVSNSIQYQV